MSVTNVMKNHFISLYGAEQLPLIIPPVMIGDKQTNQTDTKRSYLLFKIFQGQDAGMSSRQEHSEE